MSKLEVDTIAPQSGTQVTIGESGDTVTIPTGVTLDASNATTTLPANVVTTDGTQTLTNKSIAATQLTGTITPSDGTVTNAKVNASAAIDYSKLNLTGNIALADLSATGTKDATTFLRGDNTFAVPAGGTNTPAFFVRNESNQTFSSGATTQISFPNEVFDTDNAFASNGFTVPAGQGGKYFFYFTFCYINPNNTNYRIVYIVKNGGNQVEVQTQAVNSDNNAITGSALLDLSAGDFIDLDFYQNSGSNVTGLAIGGNGLQFGGFKIIE